MYQEILSAENWESLKTIHRKWSNSEEAELDTDLWSKILYDFACVYQLWERNRRTLVNIFTHYTSDAQKATANK